MEIEIGARITTRQLKRADKIVHDVAAAHGAEVVASGAGFGERDWIIECKRSVRRALVDAVAHALRDAGMEALD